MFMEFVEEGVINVVVVQRESLRVLKCHPFPVGKGIGFLVELADLVFC